MSHLSIRFDIFFKVIVSLKVVFYFLRDNSTEYSKTKDFIDKQISYVLKFGKLKSNLFNFIYSNKT